MSGSFSLLEHRRKAGGSQADIRNPTSRLKPLLKVTLDVCWGHGAPASVCLPLFNSCVCSGNESNRRAPTLISFSTLSAAMSKGLGSFSQTITAIFVQEHSTPNGQTSPTDAETPEASIPSPMPDEGYRAPPGKRVTTGCTRQRAGLWGPSDASPWAAPLSPVMSPPSPPSPCLWSHKQDGLCTRVLY